MNCEDSRRSPVRGPARLPLDVVDIIMASLEPAPESPMGKSHLATCSLVCKDWRELSTPHLFRSVTYSFTHWPTGLPRPLASLPIDSEKLWLSLNGYIYDAMSMIEKQKYAGNKYPAHRFVALFNFFEKHPDYCRSVRSVKLVGEKCPSSRTQWETISPTAFWGPVPVDKWLLVETTRLFPNLRRLSLVGLKLDNTKQPIISNPSTTQLLRTHLTCISIDFTERQHVNRHDAELTNVIDCFEGVCSLTLSNYASYGCHVLGPSHEPALHLRSLTLSWPTNLSCRALMAYPGVSNLQSLSASMYPMFLDVLGNWERLLRTIGPRLNHLECELRYDSHWQVPPGPEIALPYLSACPNLSSLKLSLPPPSTHLSPSGRRYPALDVLKAMYTSYFSAKASPGLKYASVVYLDNEWGMAWGSIIKGSHVLGRAMLELRNRVEGLEMEFVVQDKGLRQFLLDTVPVIGLLSQRGCVPSFDDEH